MPYSYKLIRSKRKSIGIKIQNNEITVQAPLNASKELIEQTLVQHEKWIEKKLNNPRMRLNFDVSCDHMIMILGKLYRLHVYTGEKRNIYVDQNDVYLAAKTLSGCQNVLKAYQISVINNYVNQIKDELKLDFNVEYKCYKSKWGCCYPKKNLIILNYLLAGCEECCIKEVIYHEIAHFKVLNHQKAFYNELARLYPDYAYSVELLKNYTTC